MSWITKEKRGYCFNGETGVGRLPIEFEVANNDDLAKARSGLLDRSQVRRLTIKGVADSGATRLVLPLSVVKRLGIPVTAKIKVQYADRRTGTRDLAEGVYLEFQGRHGIFSAIVEPNRRTALVGAIVLEELDFLLDCAHQRLVPRDPHFILGEIE
jgi:predicted aspartyl protease